MRNVGSPYSRPRSRARVPRAGAAAGRCQAPWGEPRTRRPAVQPPAACATAQRRIRAASERSRTAASLLTRLADVVPESKRVFLIVWPFLAIVVLLVLLAAESLAILSAGRAYVEGESLWSKAQKESVMHLLRYAHTRSEQDYQAFLSALAVPLGDSQARVELEKRRLRLPGRLPGLPGGRNHPDDIPGMISLFRRFRNVSYIDRSITLWAEGRRGDRGFQACRRGAARAHHLRRRPRANPCSRTWSASTRSMPSSRR